LAKLTLSLELSLAKWRKISAVALVAFLVLVERLETI
jgi:hypothetical protein